jgi:hypothetical protein
MVVVGKILTPDLPDLPLPVEKTGAKTYLIKVKSLHAKKITNIDHWRIPGLVDRLHFSEYGQRPVWSGTIWFRAAGQPTHSHPPSNQHSGPNPSTRRTAQPELNDLFWFIGGFRGYDWGLDQSKKNAHSERY